MRVTAERVVLVAAFGGLVVRLLIASTTFGASDVLLWAKFTDGVAARGPWHVYAIDYQPLYSSYNHGPLTSWMLVLFAQLRSHGIAMPLLARLPASLADVGTTIILFHLIRSWRGDRAAATAAVVFAFSPLAIVVSGFHGNTDPVFVMFGLLAALLARYEHLALWAGVAAGCAVSIKIVPFVMLPALLLLAARTSRRALRRMVAGGAVVFVVLWVPVLLTEPHSFVEHVLLYRGTGRRFWGLSQLAQWAGLSLDHTRTIGDHLGLWIGLAAALVPLALARFVRLSELTLVGLPLCLFLALSSAFSMHYMVWALAPMLAMVELRVATAYVWFSSAFIVVVYCGWTGEPPWAWNYADPKDMPAILLPLMLLVWLSLIRGCWVAVRADRGSEGSLQPRAVALEPA